ncbi:unnamed protein product [Clavelina lepadiformis]|uniref:Thioesterase domain-containing protein n=1 Tax=Clavelina lepadiformis TaxID=159417 RepID=A0ABP0FGS9_CLALP
MMWRSAGKLMSLSARCKSTKHSDVGWNLLDYKFFIPIQTRWSDNDPYGHINNGIYHEFIDLATTNLFRTLLNEEDMKAYAAIRAESTCSYQKPLHYPQVPLVGAGVTELSNKSISFSVGFFTPKSSLEDFNPVADLSFNGRIVDEDEKEKLAQHFHPHAATWARAVGVFVAADKLTKAGSVPDHLLEKMKSAAMSL